MPRGTWPRHRMNFVKVSVEAGATTGNAPIGGDQLGFPDRRMSSFVSLRAGVVLTRKTRTLILDLEARRTSEEHGEEGRQTPIRMEDRS